MSGYFDKESGTMHPVPPHHPHGTGWLYNYEKELAVKEGLKSFAKIVSALFERGEVRLGQTETVKPPERALFTIRYEQAPRGELKLKLEIEWETEEVRPGNSDGLPEID
jgi:hypothetical protein